MQRFFVRLVVGCSFSLIFLFKIFTFVFHREYRDHDCRRALGLRDYYDRLEEDDEAVEGAENREKKWEEEPEAAHHKHNKDRKSEMKFVSILCEHYEVRK